MPSNFRSWTIQPGDAVSAGAGVNYIGPDHHPSVQGVLSIEAGASLVVGRLNNEISGGAGVIDLAGGHLNAVRMAGGIPTTINISAGGTLTVSGSVAITPTYTVNVNEGGVFATRAVFSGGAHLNLSTGGAVVQQPAMGSSVLSNVTFTWNGGTLFTNTPAFSYGGSSLSTLLANWTSRPDNILALSNQLTPQTLTSGASTGTLNQGALVFTVYGPSSDDCDRWVQAANTSTTLWSGVKLHIDNASLSGPASAYVGASYKLFETSGTGIYGGINPTIAPTVWTIDGIDYSITWTNTLNVDGSLTVAAITPVVEAPSGPWSFDGDVSIQGSLSLSGSFQPAGSIDIAAGQSLIFSNDGTSVALTSPGNGRLRFDLGDGNAFEVRSSGLMLPSGALLDASGAALLGFSPVTAGVNNIRIGNAASGQAVFFGTEGADAIVHLHVAPKGGGNVGIGTATPTEKLDVAGNIRSTGTITAGKVRVAPSGDLSMGDFTTGTAPSP